MSFIGSALVALWMCCWMGGGFLALSTRDDLWLAVAAVGCVLFMPLGWLALRRGNRGAGNAWHARFGAANALGVIGGLGLALYAQTAIHNSSGQQLATMIFVGGAACFGVIATLSFRASGKPPNVG